MNSWWVRGPFYFSLVLAAVAAVDVVGAVAGWWSLATTLGVILGLLMVWLVGTLSGLIVGMRWERFWAQRQLIHHDDPRLACQITEAWQCGPQYPQLQALHSKLVQGHACPAGCSPWPGPRQLVRNQRKVFAQWRADAH